MLAPGAGGFRGRLSAESEKDKIIMKKKPRAIEIRVRVDLFDVMQLKDLNNFCLQTKR